MRSGGIHVPQVQKCSMLVNSQTRRIQRDHLCVRPNRVRQDAHHDVSWTQVHLAKGLEVKDQASNVFAVAMSSIRPLHFLR